MFLSTLAASPNTHPDTLAWLCGHAESMRGRGPDMLAMSIALAGNCAVPLDALPALHHPDMAASARDVIATEALARPGLTGQDITAILEAAQTSVVFDKAMDLARFVHDGHVVLDYVLEHGTDSYEFAAVLQHACVTPAQRVRAVAALAGLLTPTLTGTIQVVLSAAGLAGVHTPTFTDAIEIVLGAATPAELPATSAWAAGTVAPPACAAGPSKEQRRFAAWLNRVLDDLPATPTPGTPPWLAHTSTTEADVLANIRTTTPARRSWRELWPPARRRQFLDRSEVRNLAWHLALRHHPDPDGVIAHAAMDDPSLPAHELDVIVKRTRSRTALARAARANAAHKNPPSTLQFDAARLTTSALVELAIADPRDSRYLDQALARLDLSTEELQALTTHPAATLDESWGVRLALHPAATPDQRATGRDLVERATSNRRDTWTALIAFSDLTAGLDPAGDPASPARAGARLHVNSPSSTQQYPPHTSWLRQAAVDAYVTREDFTDEATRTALLALAPTFPGTIGELIATARTLAR